MTTPGRVGVCVRRRNGYDQEDCRSPQRGKSARAIAPVSTLVPAFPERARARARPPPAAVLPGPRRTSGPVLRDLVPGANAFRAGPGAVVSRGQAPGFDPLRVVRRTRQIAQIFFSKFPI